MREVAPPPLKPLIVCADDYGLDATIDDGIVALAQLGRLSAVSCLASSARWPEAAGQLRTAPPWVARGLHFNLTEGTPCSPALRQHWPRLPTLGWLVAKAHLGGLPMTLIRQELQSQLFRFERHGAQAPAYIDGHQHVHHLPGVRQCVVQEALRRGIPVRSSLPARSRGFLLKRSMLALSGGWSLATLLRRRGLAFNSVLVGVYDFRAPDYRTLMLRWLADAAKLPASTPALLVCHPASPGSPAPAADPIADARRREAAYLGSDLFRRDLAAAGLRSALPGLAAYRAASVA